MITLNNKELTILKACLDNALDAAGGDFGFSDEIHGYVSDNFNKNQVAGYLSQLQEKNLIWLDSYETDTAEGNQITFPRFAFYVAINAGILTEEEASHFEQFNDYYDMNGNPDDYQLPKQEDRHYSDPNKPTYGDVREAMQAAAEAEREAKHLCKLAERAVEDTDHEVSATQAVHKYRVAAQAAITANIYALSVRADWAAAEERK